MTTDISSLRESPFSRTVGDALRGVAILSIVLHNYLHMITGFMENEYAWHQERALFFLDMDITGWSSLPENLLSYAGHYGVAVFLFLSGLGLGIKYGAGARDAAMLPWPFIRRHYLKLLRLLMAGMVLFLIVNALVNGDGRKITLWQILGQITMTSNLNYSLILEGPYWFFSLIMEIYIIYILFLHRRPVRVIVAVMLVCVAFGYLLAPDGKTMELYRSNFPGQMLPFCLGLLAARFRKRLDIFARESGIWLPLAGFILTLPLVLALDLWSRTWLLAPAAVCLNTLFLAMIFAKTGERPLRPLIWTGTISAMVFTVHPAVRLMFIHQDVASCAGTIASYLIVTFALAQALKKAGTACAAPALH